MQPSRAYRLRVIAHLLAVGVFGVTAFAAPPPWGAVAGVVAAALIALAGWVWLRLNLQVTRIASEWQLTVDTVDFPLVTVDDDGRVVRMNRAAMEQTGRGYVENLGRPLAELGDGEPWATAARMVAGRAAGEEDGDQRLVTEQEVTEAGGDTQAGGPRSWEVSVHPVRVAGVRPRLLVLGRDVTERVRLEKELRRREVMSTLGALVGNVAHEARNPLFALQAGLDSLRGRLGNLGDAPDLLTRLELVATSAEQLQSLMQALLDYGKPIDRELKPVRLPKIADRAIADSALRAADRRVRVELSAPGEVPAVEVDEERVFQVLRNLVENAVQHSPEGGEVSVACLRHDGRVECAVTDSGPGFDPAELGQVFEPFYSRRPGGTGLGLAIVQRVVEQHGGGVEADNAPRGGGRVRFWLPAAPTTHP